MKIYGYTKVSSEGGAFGRESETKVYLSEEERNELMYIDYADTFDTIADDEDFDKENGKYVDANRDPKMTKEAFMKEIEECDDIDHIILGLIQADCFHVQYEPFNRELNEKIKPV